MAGMKLQLFAFVLAFLASAVDAFGSRALPSFNTRSGLVKLTTPKKFISLTFTFVVVSRIGRVTMDVTITAGDGEP